MIFLLLYSKYGRPNVHLYNGKLHKTFMRYDGSECYITDKRKTRKVGKNQKVIVVQPEDVQGASGELKFPTDSELFRASLPSLQTIWGANDKIDQYTGFSQDETENIEFADWSKIVKNYDDYKKESNESMGDRYVHLYNGELHKTSMRHGSESYITDKGKTRKVGKNQKVIVVQPEDVQGASVVLKFPTDSEPFRASLPLVQTICDAKIVKNYEDYKKESMGNRYVHLSNGKLPQTFMRYDGSECYITDKRKTRKVGKNQKVIMIVVQPEDVQGASGVLKFPTDSELFRAPLPSLQTIWDANDKIDQYTGFSQDETENFGFDDLSKIVKNYEGYKKERAITVERDHVVEVQIVSRAWDRANKKKLRNTRANLEIIRDSVNDLYNLNCTPGAVNMKKQSAVRRFLSEYVGGDTKGLRQNLLDYGVGPNTTRRICTTFEKSAEKNR